MRLISAFRGSRAAALARTWNNLQTQTPTKVCHRVPLSTSLPLLRCISTTSPLCLSQSQPDPFHGLSLPEEKKNEKEPTSSKPKIKEAEVVTTEEDKQRTRELIKEATRAEMSAHSIVSNIDKEGQGASDKDDDEYNGNGTNTNTNASLGPYERRLKQLDEAIIRHQMITDIANDPLPSECQTSTVMEYAQSCIDMGELQYQLGHMEESQEKYMTALKELMESSSSSDSDEDEDESNSNLKKMMIAISMHALGAIHSRCGEFDEASRWYQESLKIKRKVIEDDDSNNGNGNYSDDGSSTITTAMFHRHELGKTYNGLAALEVMMGGDVPWEKAMGLFQQAERNFLYGYEQEEEDESESVLEETMHSSSIVTKASMYKMTPRHAESLINVRSNMGELLIQRGKHDEAVETLRSALDMARMALENEIEKADAESDSVNLKSQTPIDGPSMEDQGSTIVDLLVKVADTFISAKKFDEAAEAYEQALASHVFFRRWSKDNNKKQQHPSSPKTVLPAPTLGSTNIKLDLAAATTMEAAIRNNLAHALAQIGQDNLSLEHYEASLKIIRHIGGDFHMEVAHTLMGMGALLGGPRRDFSRGLNCFKEALFIFRNNLKELREAIAGHGNSSESQHMQSFFGDEDEEEIDRHIQNALKNINLIEAALLKEKNDGAGKSR